jgi:Na+/H+-dicarboxylate symporter
MMLEVVGNKMTEEKSAEPNRDVPPPQVTFVLDHAIPKVENKMKKSIFIMTIIVLAVLFGLYNNYSENNSENNLEKMAIFSTNFGYKCGLEGNSRWTCEERMKELLLNAKDKQK